MGLGEVTRSVTGFAAGYMTGSVEGFVERSVAGNE